MSMFTYDELKTTPDSKKPKIEIKMYEGGETENAEIALYLKTLIHTLIVFYGHATKNLVINSTMV